VEGLQVGVQRPLHDGDGGRVGGEVLRAAQRLGRVRRKALAELDGVSLHAAELLVDRADGLLDDERRLGGRRSARFGIDEPDFDWCAGGLSGLTAGVLGNRFQRFRGERRGGRNARRRRAGAAGIAALSARGRGTGDDDGDEDETGH
jgi:hypothetical protein